MPNDARDALRRYLEQRRDLGESELVLDNLSVDDVMSLVSARPTVRRDVAAPADHPRLAEDDAPTVVATPSVPPEGDARSTDTPAIGDWRAMLRAAGSGPPTDRAQPREVRAPEPPPPSAEPVTEPTPVEAPTVSVPVEPRGSNAWQIAGIDVPTGLIVGDDSSELFGGPLDDLPSLDEIARRVVGCTRCALHRGAKNAVPGEGNPNADLVVVGEAPGAEEDATGRPFVGASGQLLTKILAAISLSREAVFIANVVKHRPPGNRNPEPDEVDACSPYLVRQLQLLKPKAILTVGNFAVQTLLGTKLGISKLRGQVHRYHGIPLVATYHPAALLRNPTWKRPTWEDVQLVRRILDRAQ